MISVRRALDAALQHYRSGQWQQAERLYLQVLDVNPDQVDALHLLAAIAGQTGREDEAIGYLHKVLRLRPGWAAAHNNLGMVFITRKRLPEAAASFQEAVRLQPDDAVALNNLGNALRELGRPAEALVSLQQALRIRPDDPETHYNLALAWLALWKLPEAHASCQQALRLRADHVEANATLGIILGLLGKLDDAITASRTALSIRPDAPHVHSNLILALNYHPDYDARAIQEECARWYRQHAEPLRELIQPHTNLPDSDRQLRIGYVSSGFRDHVDSFFTIPLLSNHDHRQCEIVCYADVANPDVLTERLRGYADIWRGTAGLPDQELADLVRSDRIDILVDLKMHSSDNRLLVFARKPAPVQVAWLAYPGTTGLPAIDYRLTDPYLDPPGLFDPFYAEESLRLPETFWCYDPLTDQPPVNALPATTSGIITFGCLNNFCKVNDGCLTLWSRVLQAVPRSRLLLHAPGHQAREHERTRLEQVGIPKSRFELVTRQPRYEYLKLYHRIDVALDPLPCNGHTTTLDASWMGVPTLTLIGKTVVGRAGWSVLNNLGLQECAARTPEEFLALAVRLASDMPRLEELRGTLRQRMQQSPLMDGARFARHMEQAYRRMWHRWCRDQRRDEPA
jgi:predicted O-linked N-acetylglucosamine transferase (SPINDLY family)